MPPPRPPLSLCREEGFLLAPGEQMHIRFVPRDLGGGGGMGTGFHTLSLSASCLWHLHQLSSLSPWLIEYGFVLVLTGPILFFKTLSAGAAREAGVIFNRDGWRCSTQAERGYILKHF